MVIWEKICGRCENYRQHAERQQPKDGVDERAHLNW